MAPYSSPTRNFPLIFFITALISLFPAAQAQNLQIYTDTSSPPLYAYAGCFNETTELANTTRLRALDGGISTAEMGTMTVPRCLDFCATNNHTTTSPENRFVYAGLEYSRECYCGNRLSPLSAKLDDSDCDTPCDGDITTACGGALRLSLYNLTAEARGNGAASLIARGIFKGTFARDMAGMLGLVWGMSLFLAHV